MNQKYQVVSVGYLEETLVPYEKTFDKLEDAVKDAKKMASETPEMLFIIMRVEAVVKTTFIASYRRKHKFLTLNSFKKYLKRT